MECKSLRNLCIVGVLKQSGMSVKLDINDGEISKTVAHTIHNKKLKLLNVPPKEMMNYKIHCNIPEEFLLEQFEKIYIRGNKHGKFKFKKMLCRDI